MAHTFINDRQTPEERKAKYALLRRCGFDHSWANKMRDWRYTKIQLVLKNTKGIRGLE